MYFNFKIPLSLHLYSFPDISVWEEIYLNRTYRI